MAVEFLHELNVPFFKVGSGDTNNFPYLEKTAKKGKRVLMDVLSELQQLQNKGIKTCFILLCLIMSTLNLLCIYRAVVCIRTSYGGV